jgi:hypothetical protein
MRLVQTLAVLGLVLAALVFAWSAVETSSAKVRASTETVGFFSAATVTLDRSDASAELLFDTAGLYPGKVVTGCVQVVYDGSVPADIRLHGRTVGGSGLDDYVDLTLHTAESSSSCRRGAGPPLHEGLLADLWLDHPDFGQGLVLADAAEPGRTLTVWASATVVDDDRAQGLDTEFSIFIEARP